MKSQTLQVKHSVIINRYNFSYQFSKKMKLHGTIKQIENNVFLITFIITRNFYLKIGQHWIFEIKGEKVLQKYTLTNTCNQEFAITS